MATKDIRIFVCDWCRYELEYSSTRGGYPFKGCVSYAEIDESKGWRKEELCASCAKDLKALRQRKKNPKEDAQ